MSEIVISGIAGRFPQSSDVNELWDNLINGVDMVTEDDRRWKPGLWDLPKRNGKLKEIDKFDADFFEVHSKQAENMDPALRILLEVTYEAILNAGINPSKLAGKRIGVWIGVIASETSEALAADPLNMEGYVITGCSPSMFANRISFFYDFKGPSISIDTACSSSLVALHLARQSINNGDCDAAIVGGAHLVVKPHTSQQFKKLNMLSPDGTCKVFDESANGYVRSEAVAAIYMSKKENARRIYCQVVNSKTLSDGRKEQGITFPSGLQQARLLEEVYTESGVKPSDVFYVEAHGTGTKAGDPQEVGALDHVMCREERKPLLIGSIKSNMGHSEPVAGLCGVIKCCAAIHYKRIPANLHLNKLKPTIEAMRNGRIKPVVKHVDLPHNAVLGVNSFGFGGTNVHVILRDVNTFKESSFDKNVQLRITMLSSRTNNGIKTTARMSIFSNNISDIPISKHPYRGYVINSGGDDVMSNAQWWNKAGKQREVWFICSALTQYDAINVRKLLSNANDDTYGNIINTFVGIVSIQIGLINLMTSLGVTFRGTIGHSIGELASAYADGGLNLEQTVQTAYLRGMCINQAQLPRGKMAAVGMTWKECDETCPVGVTPACHNGPNSVTISGREHDVTAFVTSLQEKNVFARFVNTEGIAFHSEHMEIVYERFLNELREIIPKPQRRSNKWLSTSYPIGDTTDQISLSSAEYFANNLKNPVFFYDAIMKIPEDAIVIEIAPHCLLQAILKRSLPPSCEQITLTNKKLNDMEVLLGAVGKLHCLGVDVQVNHVFDHTSLPLRSCDPLSSNVAWNHDQSWFTASIHHFFSSGAVNPLDATFKIDTSPNSSDFYLMDHVIDGRTLLPAMALLRLSWQNYANYLDIPIQDIAVQFDEVTIHKATVLGEKDYDLGVQYSPSLGQFTVSHNDRLLVSGKIKRIDENELQQPVGVGDQCQQTQLFTKVEIYKKLSLSGYEYKKSFQMLLDSDRDGSFGRVSWDGNYVTFMDAVLQFSLIHTRDHKLRLPTRFRRIKLRSFPKDATSSVVQITRDMGSIFAGGYMEVIDAHETVTARRTVQPQIKAKKFFPNFHDVIDDDVSNYASVLQSRVKLNNILSDHLKVRYDFGETTGTGNYVNRTFSGNTSSTLLPFLDLVTEVIDIDDLRIRAETLLFDWSIDYCLWKEDIVTSTIGIAVSELMFDVRIGEISKDIFGKKRTLENMLNDYFQSILNCRYEYYELSLDGSTMPPEGRSLNMIIANDIFTNGIKEGKTVVKKLIENLCEDTSFVMVHHSEDGNVIQAIYNILKAKMDPEHDIKKLEVSQISDILYNFNFHLVAHKRQKETGSNLLLFRHKKENIVTNRIMVEMTIGDFAWINKLQEALADSSNEVLLMARKNLNGAQEFAACLRHETNSTRIRCVGNCNLDATSTFPEQLETVLKRHHAVNAFKDGKWGSFQHVNFTGIKYVHSNRHYLDSRTVGDITSLTWMSLPPKIHEKEFEVSYAALNFRDVMLASGKINPEAIPDGNYRSLLGIEFSGVDHVGREVAGIVSGQGFATHVTQDRRFVWVVPDTWSLAEAATVPVAYSTAYYSLIVRGRIRKGESLLIHSGAGGVGQAAISIALSRGCTVYTTVSSQEKRDFLMQRFSQLHDENFAQSRNESFERDIMKRTKGKGVDVVLNSLAGEQLFASLRCLKKHGRFLEIGKFDFMQDNKLGMFVFLKNISFHGILLDSMFDDVTDEWLEVKELVRVGIEKGEVKPLPHRIFEMDDAVSAFRLMSRGNHVGKILVKINSSKRNVMGRIAFNPNLCYVITGGLGGFGLELCDWIIERGAKKLNITTTSGVKSAYQQYYLDHWKSLDVAVTITNNDVCIEKEASDLLNENVGGIFHLAATISDALFQFQTESSFNMVCQPKCNGIINLDKYSRAQCPNLEHFVAFSSAVSHNGSKGQSNYILANSVMEQLCRLRHNVGLPGIAIQWGAIRDVGMAAEKFGYGPVAGTVQQPMESCLKNLDRLLLEGEPVVACYIPFHESPQTAIETKVENSLVLKVSKILGFKDLQKVNEEKTLLSLGADSLMITEIVQTLDRDYNITMTTNDVRELTFEKLMTFTEQKAK